MKHLRIRTVSNLNYLVAFLLVNLIFGGLAFQVFDAQVLDLGYYQVSAKLRLLRGFLIIAIMLNGLAIPVFFTSIGERLINICKEVFRWLAQLGYSNLIFALVIFSLFPFIVQSEYGLYIKAPLPRLWLFWLLANIAGLFFFAWRRGTSWFKGFLISSLLMGSAHVVGVFLARISNYPLSLGWSEVSRYYQASFYFSERLYGLDLPWSVTHPSRYILQAAPFLFPDLGLRAHRAWEVLLWLGLTALTAWLLARRINLSNRWMVVLVTVWASLFMFQGAVFFHLMLCLIPVLFGFDKENYSRTMLFVLIASVWAGISRINWGPMPGLLAACLMYLEQPEGSRARLPWPYFWRSFSYFLLGLATSLASYFAYIALSGNESVDQFSSPFTSALLWNRLWPNPSFPLGIVPGILIVSLPLLILVVWKVSRALHEWHYFRLLGLATIGVVLLIGGLVVSVKIGGGTNLHNMDAFMVILMVVGVYLAFDRHAKEPDAGYQQAWEIPPFLLTLIVLVPIVFALGSGGSAKSPNTERAWEVIGLIDTRIERVLRDGGEVLFISQRQLLMFNMLASAPQLVPEYEQLFLMEMAISHNRPYLEQLYQDLESQRFDLIITDPIFLVEKVEGQDPLAAENNAWLEEVAQPVLCAYGYEKTYRDVGVQVLAPRPQIICDVNHAHSADQ